MTPKPLEEFAAEAQEQARVERDERRLGDVRRENERLRSRVSSLEAELADKERLERFFGRLDDAQPDPPKWLSPPKPKQSHATLMLLLSDMHFDEVVNPDEMDGLNAYDREIATVRLERWAKKVVELARHYLSGVTYDGVCLMLGGDTFSGSIHEELKESNADLLFKSLLYWIEQVAAAIDLLAGEFGKVHVAAVPGNHGRMTRKPRFKGRAADNLDWLLAKLLERDFHGDNRVTFQVPDTFDAYFQVYDRGQLLMHGDQVNGGSGIGGIWPPIMRLRARQAQAHMTIGKPFETLWIGHWHQLIQTPSMVINGALKGYDEYARGNSLPFEVPQQAMALMTPKHGITWQAPVIVGGRDGL